MDLREALLITGSGRPPYYGVPAMVMPNRGALHANRNLRSNLRASRNLHSNVTARPTSGASAMAGSLCPPGPHLPRA
jgi:hypothetical protein